MTMNEDDTKQATQEQITHSGKAFFSETNKSEANVTSPWPLLDRNKEEIWCTGQQQTEKHPFVDAVGIDPSLTIEVQVVKVKIQDDSAVQ